MSNTTSLFPKPIDDRITVDPQQCGGRPCIRGMRVRVTDVLDLLASGLNVTEIIGELPYLEPADVEACLRFASRRIDHPVITV
ncbi:MAG TPA: DUF433 domain-containing protein [Planctomycetaceae bacterium]|nr:DUF433 domain-containing protein [Planctomycetaceae bacterium]HQZ64576.1 DUF433 domain-containing protein [Planctomycetaceae bacterium]HRA86781.1 DUF433 domain-containing protein [Planctomycetaceae bacterium]